MKSQITTHVLDTAQGQPAIISGVSENVKVKEDFLNGAV